jgi:hypothetical protein
VVHSPSAMSKQNGDPLLSVPTEHPCQFDDVLDE